MDLVERIFSELAPSDRRIFALAVSGLSNGDIAVRIGRTVRSVKVTMTKIYRATGMSHSRELLAFVYAHPELCSALRDFEPK